MIESKRIKDSVTKSLNEKIQNAKSLDIIWKRSLKKDYLEYQKQRFITENDRNGGWKKLNPKYAAYKKNIAGTGGKVKRLVLSKDKRITKNKQVIEGGIKLMVFTGQLRDSILAKNNEYKEITTPSSVTVLTTVPYAGYADSQRTFTKFDPKFREFLRKKIAHIIGGGK